MVMKNIVTNNIDYAGIVTISLQEGDKIIKTQKISNSGTSTLFSFFAYCLMGEFDEASLYCPTKVRLLKVPVDETTGIEGDPISASGLIYLRSRPERVYNPEIDGETVKLSFMIPRTMIESVGFNRIALYPQYADETCISEYSAYCDLSGAEDLGVDLYTAWTLSSVLLVDWELTVSNKIIRVKETTGGNA